MKTKISHAWGCNWQRTPCLQNLSRISTQIVADIGRMVGLTSTTMVSLPFLILQAFIAVVWATSESGLKPEGSSRGSPENSPTNTGSAEDPPNLVFVLVDDVGWADFSYNVEKGAIPTPGYPSPTRSCISVIRMFAISVDHIPAS